MWPSSNTTYLLLSAYGLLGSASPVDGDAYLEERQSCPDIHVFGARETTASAGYGSSATVVNAILSAYSGSTAEAISYPACGGQSSCGSISYSSSVQQGIAAAASAVNNFYTKCPSTQLVLVGYSQGAEIFDVALCGGGDPNQGYTNTAVQISSGAVNQVKAAILMGAPTYVYGLSYDVGTCKAGGFDARSSSFQCPSASKIQSYCDAADPYCCNGSDANTHQGYGSEYGSQALAFVKSKLSSTSTTSTTTTSAPATTSTSPSTGGNCAALYGQCGGQDWTGATCCASGTCKVANSYYSQCL
ncbi:Acetylxylan esterase 2 [Cytospora mali]|uniref:Acetylxylan esterase 2 n=1 Tax=Cytospora mali TaxID=578113 RepID=A0A194UVR9_CYTMA|nr:Acetylxylan esterase 2 [Valsa mali var. pyri (nom. inval.)]